MTTPNHGNFAPEAEDWLFQMPTEADLERAIEGYEARIAQYRQKANALRLVLQARRMYDGQKADLSWLFSQALFPGRLTTGVGSRTVASGEINQASRPGTSEAVMQVLMSDPTRAWGAKEIFDALAARGWLPDSKEPRKALGATLSRLSERTKEIDRVGRGLYRLPPDVARRLTDETLALTASHIDEPSLSADRPKATASNRLFPGSADGEAESEDV